MQSEADPAPCLAGAGATARQAAAAGLQPQPGRQPQPGSSRRAACCPGGRRTMRPHTHTHTRTTPALQADRGPGHGRAGGRCGQRGDGGDLLHLLAAGDCLYLERQQAGAICVRCAGPVHPRWRGDAGGPAVSWGCCLGRPAGRELGISMGLCCLLLCVWVEELVMWEGRGAYTASPEGRQHQLGIIRGLAKTNLRRGGSSKC